MTTEPLVIDGDTELTDEQLARVLDVLRRAGKVAAEYVDPRELTPNPRNPRKNDHAVPGVMGSIRRFGFGAPLVVTEEGAVIAGHTRLKAALRLQELGELETVPVRRMSISEADALGLSLADNKFGELALWDYEGLQSVLRDAQDEFPDLTVLGFSQPELENILAAEWTPPPVDDAYQPTLSSGKSLTFSMQEWENIERAVLKAREALGSGASPAACVAHACAKWTAK